MINPMKNIIYTHAGDFHVDELLAIALLKRFVFRGDEITIIRSREKPIIERACMDPEVFVIDIGLQYEPDKLNFDHHQAGGAISWEDGTPLSSCGLVWQWVRKHGFLSHIEDEELDRIEHDLIRQVDSHDNGLTKWPLATIFRMYNRQGAHPDTIFTQFIQALHVADELLENQIIQSQLDISSERALQQAWDECQGQNDGIVIVHKQLGNRSSHTLLAKLSNYQANFMLFPQTGSRNNKKWYIRALPESETSPRNKYVFPKFMQGTSNKMLDLGDGTTAKFHFVHNAGFLACVEGELYDAYRVAKAILNHPENIHRKTKKKQHKNTVKP